MNDAAACVLEAFREAFGRSPEEHELSFYLHRALIGGVPLPVLRQEILAAARPANDAGRLMRIAALIRQWTSPRNDT